MSNTDEFVFPIVVSTCSATATDTSTTVFNAFSISAATFCITVSYSGKRYVISRDFSLSIHSSVGIHSTNCIIQNLIIQNQLVSLLTCILSKPDMYSQAALHWAERGSGTSYLIV